MIQKEKDFSPKKKFKLRDYKGYVFILIILVVILFVLLGMAAGMIRKQFGQEMVQSSEIKNKSDKETILQTLDESETQTNTETETYLEEESNDSLLVLINKDHPVPEDLQYKLVKIEEHHYIDERAYSDLQNMLTDAKNDGYELVICSSWRSYALQEKLYENKIEEYLSDGYSEKEAEELAAFWVAVPGSSEHEIGLALDIVSKWYQHLTHDQAYTPEQQWLMMHCHEYGFILRYPENKQEITNIGYEPWHYRYVGEKAAKVIMEQGLCLEEYLMEVE